MSRKKILVWSSIAAGTVAAALIFSVHHWRPRWSIVQGAVIRSDTDVRKQSPIADVLITASHGTTSLTTRSDATGYFSIAFPGTVLPGQTVTLIFRHPDYKTLDLSVPIRFRSSLRQLVIAAMQPNTELVTVSTGRQAVVVSGIKVRYTYNSRTEEEIGSAVQTFQVVNQGDVPCDRHVPCSPDGYWKASTGSVTLDAGEGNEFLNARASCIAGPCPFTQIDSSGFAHGGRTIVASATDWSDTATFLVQAEVYRTESVSKQRESYPVVFGRTLNFSVPPTAEGVCLEAELNGVSIVFPLGPDVYLDWATCGQRTGPGSEKSLVYQCELKPGYRFPS